MVRAPYTLRHIHPSELAEWDLAGRILVTRAFFEAVEIVLLTIYGYPPSHPDVASNDALITQCLAWAGKQIECTLVTGDLNCSQHDCHVLSAPREVNMHRISPNTHSTRSRTSSRQRHPLDHALVNATLLSFFSSSSFDYSCPLSDHFPLVCDFYIPTQKRLVWHWPTPCKHELLLLKKFVPFDPVVSTFTEWSEKATQWLRASYDVDIEPKMRVHASVWKPKR